MEWIEGLPADVLGLRRGAFACVINFADQPAVLPAAVVEGTDVLLASDSSYTTGPLPAATAIWLVRN